MLNQQPLDYILIAGEGVGQFPIDSRTGEFNWADPSAVEQRQRDL